MKTLMSLVFVTSLISFTPLAFGWYDTDWSFAKKITLDDTYVGTNQNNFPLLINITDADLAAEALANGNDIVFIHNDNSTVLKHEIEEWDSGSGYLVAWVKVNATASSDYEFYMYYGNSGASNSEKPENLWKDYESVHHLHDDFLDSTANNHDGTNSGSTDQACSIGDCQSFDGINDDIDLDAYTTLDDNISDLTIYAWVDWNNVGGASESLMGQYAASQASFICRIGTSGDIELYYIAEPNDAESISAGGDIVTTNDWELMTCQVELGTADDERVWVDKSKNTQGSSRTEFDNTQNNNANVIGNRHLSSDWFSGEIDEVQIAYVAFPDDWTELKHDCEDPNNYDTANQENQCIDVGAEEENTGGSSVTTSDEIALEDGGVSYIYDHSVSSSDEIALEDQGATGSSVGAGTGLVSDEIALEDGGVTGMTNTVSTSDEIALEDGGSYIPGFVTPTYNAIILSLNSPTDTRLGGVFNQTCADGFYMYGIGSDGNLLCRALPP